jgi:inorganic pyrophosphatase
MILRGCQKREILKLKIKIKLIITMNKNFFNPWHHTPIGDNVPEVVTGIIEIPKGTRAKYELNKETGRLRLDRVIYSAMYYPANYGFIPQTYCDDHDPLDILVLSQIDIRSLCEVNAKVIGVMRMIDQGEADDKIIAVAADDISVSHINDIEELPEHLLRELRNFFEDYKKLENKEVIVEEFLDKEMAIKIILQSIEDYKKYMQQFG